MAKRTRLTRPYPTHALEEVVPIAETIQTVNGGQPVATDLLAKSLGTTPKSSAFVQKLKSSAGYGLTVGSHTSERVEVTPLGESLTAPRDEEERALALQTAALGPEVFSRFFDMYAGKRFPEDEFASNALVRDIGIHPGLAEECLRLLRRNGVFVQLVAERGDGLFVERAAEPAAPPGVADSERLPAYSASGALAQPEPVRPAPRGVRRDSGFGPSGHDAAAVSAGPNTESPSVPTDSPMNAPTSAPPNSRTEDEPPSELATALIVSQPGDPLAGAVAQVMATLSLPVSDVDLDSPSPRPSPPELSDALRPARGCVVVWPSGGFGDFADADRRLLRARAWLALGAASHVLGDKVIVVAAGGADPDLAAASESLDLTVIDASNAAAVYPALMGALIAKSVVQVSWG